ncbi:MAG: contractile injection system protein, VgrG/Pvc8 family, partial [Saezia sp.]
MAQTDLRFSFEIASSTDDAERDNTHPIQLDVLSFTLEEDLNSPFKLEVELISFDAAIDFNELIDKPVLFTISRGGTAVRHIHGLVSTFEQGKSGHRRTHYRAIVEPSLARLNLTSDWRIFQQTPANEILSSVL